MSLSAISSLDFSPLCIRYECLVPHPKVNGIPDNLRVAPQDFSAETARTLPTTMLARSKENSLSHLSLEAFSLRWHDFKMNAQATKRMAVVAEI